MAFLKGWTFSPVYQHGSIYRHTPKFKPDTEGSTNAIELNISKQTNGKKAWQQIHHYPSPGIAISFTDYGNDEILGQSISIMPNMNVPLIRSDKFSLQFLVGAGIAFLSKHYDYHENPTNNVIASTVNNITSFSLSGNWKFARQLSLFGGGSFTHFSTGAVRLPNLGINVPAWNFGLRYQPVPYSTQEFIKKELPPATKKILFAIQAGIGFQEAGAPNGPMYHLYLTEIAAGIMLTRWNKISAGIMGTYKEAASSFIKQEEIYPDHFFANSCAISGFVKDDILFGFTGISLMVGYNFYQPSPLEYGFYQKLGVPFYFPAFGKEKNDRISIGVYVVAGDFTADYVSIDTGFQF